MKRFTQAVEIALRSGNWYGALSLALTLPDVCGRLETPNEGVGKRYMKWFKTYVQPKYTSQDGHVFLAGDDCYALRCSYLHEGSGDIVGQKARKALDKFHFISPPTNGSSFHILQSDTALMLQIDKFCEDIIEGVGAWEAEVAENRVVEQQKNSLLEIRDVTAGFSF